MHKQHLSMFKKADNEQGYIQCVIGDGFKHEFMSLGFVTSVDDLDYTQEEPTPDAQALTNEEEAELAELEALKAEAKALGLKGYGNSSAENLRKKIEDKKAELAEAEKVSNENNEG
ncbi:hypothetical protein PODOV084v1_p0004 [Vibrio phage 340E47.2]|nr:hypothetical protein PODOV084v1_p0004 [Vibrio phage 340E47.2]QZI91962.1 hypothetical protein PODOV077v1_p0051 [Vibrio phage 5P1a]